MNLGEFHTLLRDSLKRGDALDGILPTYVKMAVTHIERNWTFKYMEELALLQMVEGDRVVELPYYIKGVEWLRFAPVGTVADYTYVTTGEASSVVTPENGAPTHFSILNYNKLIFNPIPDMNYSGEILLHSFTDWPTADNSRHFLLDMGADLLLGQTLLMMAIGVLRDPRMVEGFKLMRDEAMRTMLMADESLRYTGADLRMGYTPYYLSK